LQRRNEVIFRYPDHKGFGRTPAKREYILRTVSSFLLPILLILPAWAQEKENAGNSDGSVVETTIKHAAVHLYESSDLRDPFLNLAPSKPSDQRGDVDEEVPREHPPSGIEGTFIDKAGLEGIVIRGDNRRTAIIRGADNRAYFLREGDRLFDGYLKTITKDSVVFVRESKMKSGKIMTREVTKQLRKS